MGNVTGVVQYIGQRGKAWNIKVLGSIQLQVELHILEGCRLDDGLINWPSGIYINLDKKNMGQLHRRLRPTRPTDDLHRPPPLQALTALVRWVTSRSRG